MRAVMALSGGMDSTALLCRLIADGYEVSCISYDYGQKHVVELERAKANIAYLSAIGISVEHKIVDLSGVMGIFHSALTNEEIDVPRHFRRVSKETTRSTDLRSAQRPGQTPIDGAV